ncbi:MAG: RHS repeat domain-containing protein [Cytophaga sp.]|uniref:RHS repeat domain-containing protein n=1 Tax=Cytophaga sp. TaxID=29535 RepID=UPI003F8057D0
MLSKYILPVFLFLCVFQGFAQSLSIDDENLVTAGVQSDLNLGATGYTTARGPVVDVHNNSGVVVYAYQGADAVGSSNHDIYCVIYDKKWNVITPEFRVNYNTSGDQSNPVVRVNQNDNSFVIGWSSNHGADGDYDVYTKKINLYIDNPAAVTNVNENSNKVNTSTVGKQLLINMCFDYVQNELILAWREYNGNDGSGVGMYAGRVYYPDYTVVGTDFLVNQTTANNQTPYGLEYSPVTNQLIAMYTSVPSSGASDVYVRRFTRSGTGTFVGMAEVKANSTTVTNHWSPTMTLNSTTGAYALAWNADGQYGPRSIAYKVYDKNGAQLKAESNATVNTTCNTYNPRIMWDEGTGYIVVFYYANTCSTSPNLLNYQIINNSYTFVGTQQNAVSTDAANGTAGLMLAYSQKFKKSYIAYSIWSGSNSNAFARTLIYANASIPPPLSSCSTDPGMIWEQTTYYDENGNIIDESRIYYDKMNRVTQTQYRNIAAGNILAKATLYDQMGRKAITTLPAPINQTCFTYNPNFVKDTTGHTYTYQYFDNRVATATPGTLGYYYSNNNTTEPFVATTGFPYQRVGRTDTAFGGQVSAAMPGDSLQVSKNKTDRLQFMSVGNEMNNYAAVRNSYITTNAKSCACGATKIIATDPNGKQEVSIVDKNGRLLSTVTADSTNAAVNTVSFGMGGYYYYNFKVNSLGYRVLKNITVQGTDSIWVYSHTTPYSSGVYLYYAGLPANFYLPTQLLDSMNLYTIGAEAPIQVRSKQPFKVKYLVHYQGVPGCGDYTQIDKGTYYNGTGTSASIYLKKTTSFSLSSTKPNTKIKVTSLSTGKVVYTGLTSAFNVSTLKLPDTYKFETIDYWVAPTDNVYTSTYYAFPVTETCGTPSVGFYQKTLDSVANANITISYYNDFTKHNYVFYDDLGRVINNTEAKGVNLGSSAKPAMTVGTGFNTMGQLLSKNDPDSKLITYVYRKDGKLRFSQNNKQKQTNKFTYINYDRYGRVVEVGEYDPALDGSPKTYEVQTLTPSGPSSVINILESVAPGGGLGGPTCSCRTNARSMVYSVPDPAIPVARTQRFLQGKLSYKYSSTAATWFSYDELGRIEWLVKSIYNFGGAGVTKTVTIDYTYDMVGNILSAVYQKGTAAERFEHKYTYDISQRLIQVQSRPGAGIYQNEAKYYYYLHGPLKREELADTLQGIDYIYTVNGDLKAINSPTLDNTKDPGKDGYASSVNKSFGRDVFGLQLQYYDGDYVRSGTNVTTTALPATIANNYDGSIKAAKWQTRGHDFSGSMGMYAYTYDGDHQLTGASFGTVAAASETVFTASSNFNVYNLTYDKNKNMLTKTTKDNTGSIRNDFVYEYDPTGKTNQLADVKYNGTSNYYATYQYDSIGQMNHVHYATSDMYIDYDMYKKVTAVYTDAAKTIKKVTFAYDENGLRLNKVTYVGGVYSYTTWYVHDENGALLSVYDDNSHALAQTELSVYGISKLGQAYVSGSTYTYVYQLTDNIGNIRATIARSRSGVDATILSWADYYPFGSVMPGRSGVSSLAYRTGFQGAYAETDAETGWLNFEARMFDTEIGRWFVPDPCHADPSPYAYVGNDPVNKMDEDGRKPHILRKLSQGLKKVVVAASAVVVGAAMCVVGVWTGQPELVAAGIGGALNTLSNIDHIVGNNAEGSGWKQIKRGAEYFAAGAIGGALTLVSGAGGMAAAGALNAAIDANNGYTQGKNGHGYSAKALAMSFVNGAMSVAGVGDVVDAVASGGKGIAESMMAKAMEKQAARQAEKQAAKLAAEEAAKIEIGKAAMESGIKFATIDPAMYVVKTETKLQELIRAGQEFYQNSHLKDVVEAYKDLQDKAEEVFSAGMSTAPWAVSKYGATFLTTYVDHVRSTQHASKYWTPAEWEDFFLDVGIEETKTATGINRYD